MNVHNSRKDMCQVRLHFGAGSNSALALLKSSWAKEPQPKELCLNTDNSGAKQVRTWGFARTGHDMA